MKYGIAEWYGHPFLELSATLRQRLAERAGDTQADLPQCPFQNGHVKCNKKGGVCSIQQYEVGDDRIIGRAGNPVITCPKRFAQDDVVLTWLADIVGFNEVYLAQEVPFMRSSVTGKAAGRIDMVLAGDSKAAKWYGLEIQAVYFSGSGMSSDFDLLRTDDAVLPPAPTAIRRPDWRSSGAKRLMPQLQVKARLMREWGVKLAVAVDAPFFDNLGGASAASSHDLNDGNIIWIVPRVSDQYRLERVHWEVLSLEASSDKLLAAEPVKRGEFEKSLREKLKPIWKTENGNNTEDK